jgi:Cu(I)/Ag(I) efflux system membrane fusion protein
MTRKIIYILIFFFGIIGAYLIGSRSGHREMLMHDLSVGRSLAGKTAEDKKNNEPEQGSAPRSPGTINLNPEKQQLIGVKVMTVEKTSWNHTLRALGRVIPDENRIYRINAATDGWVKKVLPPTTDSLVKKDELLASYYAPEFFSAMKAYLYGLRSFDRFEKSGQETKGQLDLTDANIENYRNALRNLGMTEHQLDEIKSSRKGGDQVEIRAPEAGFILSRNLSLGERFQRGTELYRIVDLSKVWIVVDTFETEAASFKPGMPVRVSAPNLGKTFSARAARVPPRFNPATRGGQPGVVSEAGHVRGCGTSNKTTSGHHHPDRRYS